MTRVSQPRDWTNSTVTGRKPSKLRIRLDPKYLNVATKWPRYPMPTIDDVLPRLSRQRYFRCSRPVYSEDVQGVNFCLHWHVCLHLLGASRRDLPGVWCHSLDGSLQFLCWCSFISKSWGNAFPMALNVFDDFHSVLVEQAENTLLFKISGSRPVTNLGHQAGRRVFWEGAKFFKLFPIASNYVQRIFPGGANNFSPPYLWAW